MLLLSIPADILLEHFRQRLEDILDSILLLMLQREVRSQGVVLETRTRHTPTQATHTHKIREVRSQAVVLEPRTRHPPTQATHTHQLFVQDTAKPKFRVIKKIVLHRQQTLARLIRNVTGKQDSKMANARDHLKLILLKGITIGVTVSNGKHQKLVTTTNAAIGHL